MNRCWTAILALIAVMSARAEPAADRLAAAGVLEFTAAYQTWDGEKFAVATEFFRQATTNAPASAIHFYWLGTAQFHRMLQIQNQPGPVTHRAEASVAMEAAIVALSRAVKLDPRHDECHALLGTLYGMKIDGSAVRAAWFGPRVDKHRRQALKHGANNPRVRYLLGTGQFHMAKKPPALREALATLLLAEKLFAAENPRPAGALDPRWGHASCLTFIGRTYEQLGQRKEGAEFFRKALAQQPSNHLAQAGLARVTGKP